MGKHALLVVDVQRDFCPGGSLGVEAGDRVAMTIAADLLGRSAGYDYRLSTRDMHVEPGDHFSEEPDFAGTWPAHCRAGTAGAEFHEALEEVRAHFDAIFDKGHYQAAYSGFEGATSSGVSLSDWLSDAEVDRVDVVGIATDYCVRATAFDAAVAGLSTRLLLGYTAGVAHASTQEALGELAAAKVEIVGDATANGIAWSGGL